ncbi:MAG TPA: hypothetical protein VNA17_01530, partial [Pyrinomonadaceae bacterium]|nr:hypothetical protein [Pyrinomonadaceae bacterium]
MKVKTLLQTILIPLMFVCWNIQVGFAQTTVFDYQGRLADERGHPVNGAFQFRFRLFDAAEGGTEIGSMEMRIVVTAGLYNARLDFGEGAFPGTDRFMEVSFQKNPFQPYFTLTPRDQVVSAPYSIKSKSSETAANSNQLSGVPADQFVQINHPALSDDRNPVPGSMNYIQNTVVQQSGA